MPSEPKGNLYVNALIGAVVTTVTSFLPFVAPVVGGAVAAYLEGGDRERGVKTGAISGVFASVPLVLLGLGLFLFVPFALALSPDHLAAGLGAFAIVAMVFVVIAFVAAYTVGLSALGGLLGIALLEED